MCGPALADPCKYPHTDHYRAHYHYTVELYVRCIAAPAHDTRHT